MSILGGNTEPSDQMLSGTGLTGNAYQFTRVTVNVGGDSDGKFIYYAVDNNLRTYHTIVEYLLLAGERYVITVTVS